MLHPLKPILDFALESGFGVPALNANNIEQLTAIMEAARKTGSPAIVQLSRGARAYAGDWAWGALLRAAAEQYREVPLVAHLDHGNKPETCFTAIKAGFTSVMMDGSLLEDGKTALERRKRKEGEKYDFRMEGSFWYNVAVTRHVVEVARANNVSVEGEVGCLGQLLTGGGEKEDEHGAERQLSREEMLTDPDEAAAFVAATGVDCLAVAIGTSHGAYKFPAPPTEEVLAIAHIQRIHAKIPSVPLVMHGSSSLPQELRDLINQYGGKLKPAWGVPIEEIQRAIKSGVAKINVDTDNRLAMAGAVRKVLTEHPEKFDPREFLRPAREAMQRVCEERMIAFGSAGKAEELRRKLGGY
jgi:fructose-bisphosphate aldolase class II